jgi:hypothetical protein
MMTLTRARRIVAAMQRDGAVTEQEAERSIDAWGLRADQHEALAMVQESERREAERLTALPDSLPWWARALPLLVFVAVLLDAGSRRLRFGRAQP